MAHLISPTTKLNIHTKVEVNKKMTQYIVKFEEELIASNESNQTIKEKMVTIQDQLIFVKDFTEY